MTSRFKPLILITICLLGAITIQAHAKVDTSQEFLNNQTEGQRAWYYIGAFETLGNAVAINNPTQGTCIWNWYANDSASRRVLIENTMQKYPTHTPSAVIIALLHKDCGVFNVK
jgi:hypothetical protein